MARSACCTIVVVAMAVLSAVFGSFTAELTVAVFVIEAPPNVEEKVYVQGVGGEGRPAAGVPMAHGYGVVQAPLLETKARPVGVTSPTVTPVAGEGPAFMTLIVYVTVWPGAAEAVPLFAM